MKRLVCVVVVLTSVVMASPTSVHSAGGYMRYPKRTVRIPAGQMRDIEVTCPAESHAIAPGYSAPRSVRVSRAHLSSVGPNYTAVVRATNTGARPATVTASAVCLTNVVNTSSSSASLLFTSGIPTPIDPGSQDQMTLDCPVASFDYVLSGGFVSADGAEDMTLASSYPTDGDDLDSEGGDAWVMWMGNPNAASQNATPQVICSNLLRPVVVAGPTVTVQQGRPTRATVMCPRDVPGRVTGGGVLTTGIAPDIVVRSSHPVVKRKPTRTGWSTVVTSDSGDEQATAYAVCLQPQQ